MTTFVILLLNVWMLSIHRPLRAFQPQVLDLFTLSSYWWLLQDASSSADYVFPCAYDIENLHTKLSHPNHDPPSGNVW